MVPFNVSAWHAGKSDYNGRANVNAFSVCKTQRDRRDKVNELLMQNASALFLLIGVLIGASITVLVILMDL